MKRLLQILPVIFCASLLFYAGCSGDDAPGKVDCSASDLAVSIESVNPESCALSNGSITATVTGGKAPYTYALNTGAFGATSTFTLLSAGDYVIRVKDKNGCVINSDDVALRIPGNTLSASATTEPDTECVSNNGSITVTATGGTEPYQYKLGSGAFGANNVFSSLPSANYTVTVKDAEGCLFPRPVTVGQGDTGTSLSTEIQPIINAKCAVSGCHNGSQEPNLTSLQAIRTHSANIRALTQSGAMPQEGSLTASEKAKIACWVDDGAKDN